MQIPTTPPRQSTALRQQFATANSTTDSGLFLFPKNLLTSKIFLGALIIFGVLGAFFTRPSPPRQSTALRQQFATANSTTDSGLFLFPKNLLTSKIFLGALIIFGVLGAFFNPTSPQKNKRESCALFIFCMLKFLWGSALCVFLCDKKAVKYALA